MKTLQEIQSVYFVGAGGIGMSALARYFLAKGKKVGGYDRTPTPLTEQLNREGATIHFDDDVALIPQWCKDRATTLVVRTPAVPNSHSELTFFRDHDFDILKRAQVLGIITRWGKALCVAGTHGKTTTSTMLAHLLHQSHVGCTAFLGGISKNYDTNLLLSDSSPYIVVEADEFDRSFHQLSPYMTAITAVDPDHLDIYGTAEAYHEGFEEYLDRLQQGGYLFKQASLAFRQEANLLQRNAHVFSYSCATGDFHAENIRMGGGEIVFDFVTPTRRVNDIPLGVPVSINIENGVAAMAMAMACGLSDDELREGMRTFRGVDRRFDFILKTPSLAFLIDYAHHPEEITQCLRSLRDIYPGKRITAVFQPHLYTRTRDFYRDFAKSLSLADKVFLTEIYPARELPIEGVSSRLIYDNLRSDVSAVLCTKAELSALLAKEPLDVLVVLGAGDIDELVPDIRTAITHRL
jgi:UDP-N-acetylmuramate--alanine ligase